MTNRFPLSQVLRIREIAADREEQALGRILAEMARVRDGIDSADRAIQGAVTNRERDLDATLHGGHLHASCHHADLLRRHRIDMRVQLERLEAERAVQTRAWETARQKREVLTGMRDEQQAAWRLMQSRAAVRG
jgi:flagellar export protein FliJ